MKTIDLSVGIIGGSGMLGQAIVHALLSRQVVAPENLWISNRSGNAPSGADYTGIRVVSENEELCRACEIVVLSVPPSALDTLNIAAGEKLIISVMAGMDMANIRAATGAERVVRAMSSPAARDGLAYSPWVASPAVTETDRALIHTIFSACGETDELEKEEMIDHFTAMTGPVPGFVAFYAKCMVDYAIKSGIPAGVADKAIKQLFLSAGNMMATDAKAPDDHVQKMLDYAGTTAAGLQSMQAGPISDEIAKGLEAAVTAAQEFNRAPGLTRES